MRRPLISTVQALVCAAACAAPVSSRDLEASSAGWTWPVGVALQDGSLRMQGGYGEAAVIALGQQPTAPRAAGSVSLTHRGASDVWLALAHGQVGIASAPEAQAAAHRLTQVTPGFFGDGLPGLARPESVAPVVAEARAWYAATRSAGESTGAREWGSPGPTPMSWETRTERRSRDGLLAPEILAFLRDHRLWIAGAAVFWMLLATGLHLMRQGARRSVARRHAGISAAQVHSVTRRPVDGGARRGGLRQRRT
jgi:hypothetical protein